MPPNETVDMKPRNPRFPRVRSSVLKALGVVPGDDDAWRLAPWAGWGLVLSLCAAGVAFTWIRAASHIEAWVGLAAASALSAFVLGTTKAVPDDTQAEGKKGKELSAQQASSLDNARLELVKLNYEQSRERYENIYRAIWQNFSYMAILAGAILTFGREHPDQSMIRLAALSPLVFWYLATFLPMNHYGERTRSTLVVLESGINDAYLKGWDLLLFDNFRKFSSRRFRWRVRHAVHVFSVVVIGLWLWVLSGVVYPMGRTGKVALERTGRTEQRGSEMSGLGFASKDRLGGEARAPVSRDLPAAGQTGLGIATRDSSAW